MSGNLYTYRPDMVRASIFGITLKGFVTDSFITVERQSPTTTLKKAMDGSGTAFIDQHGSYKVTLKIDPSSESNTLLDLIYRVYMKSGANLRMPLIISDRNSGSIFTSLDTLFDGDPNKHYAQKSQPYDWVFLCESPTNSIIGYDDDTTLFTALQRVLDFIDTAETLGLNLTAIEDKLSDSISSITSKLSNLI